MQLVNENTKVLYIKWDTSLILYTLVISWSGKTKNLLTKTKIKIKKRVFSKLELANSQDLNIYKTKN